MTESPAVTLLYLYGAGGHGRELGWLARAVLPEATLEYIVDDPRFLAGPINGIPVRLFTEVEAGPGVGFVAAVGDTAVRRIAASAFAERHVPAVALVHPRAETTPNVRIAAGAVVCAGSVLTDNVEIGQHAHVNIGCTLSHDVWVGEFATLSPGVRIAGNVIVESGAFLGIGATVINGSSSSPLVVGAGSVVAAGAVVTTSVDKGAVVGGVPARALRSKPS